MEEKNKSIYIVTSFTNTLPGNIIKLRAYLKFWNRYAGDAYSHVSISKDEKLGNMLSLARKNDNYNFLNAGLVEENIRSGLFKRAQNKAKVAVMKLDVTDEQYNKLNKIINGYLAKKEDISFNFLGTIIMIFSATGIDLKRENKFFCSQWVLTVLKEAGIDIFNGKKEPFNVRPLDFYDALANNIIFEGQVSDYIKQVDQITEGQVFENEVDFDFSISNSEGAPLLSKKMG